MKNASRTARWDPEAAKELEAEAKSAQELATNIDLQKVKVDVMKADFEREQGELAKLVLQTRRFTKWP